MLFARKPYDFCKPGSIDTQSDALSKREPRFASHLACWREGCEKSPVGFFNVKPFCAEHFIYVCYQKLDSIVSDLRYTAVGEKKRLRFQAELGQIADQVYVVSLWGEALTRFEQIRLLEILDHASTSLTSLRARTSTGSQDLPHAQLGLDSSSSARLLQALRQSA